MNRVAIVAFVLVAVLPSDAVGQDANREPLHVWRRVGH